MVVPVALFSRCLLLSMTLGSVWHHHANSSETNCPICHLSHQPVDRPLASDRTPTLAAVGPRMKPQDPDFVLSRVTERIPARAPPSA